MCIRDSLLDEVHVDVIKGNLSEVKAVMEHGRCDGGVEVTDTAAESLSLIHICKNKAGGLMENSRWLNDPEFNSLLR